MKYKGLVIITGVNIREAKKLFKNTDRDSLLDYQGKKFKLNPSAAAAIELNNSGYLLYLISSSKKALKIISESYLNKPYYYSYCDLLDKKSLLKTEKDIKRLKEKYNLNVHLVHYGSASETKVKLPKETIFLNFWSTPSESIVPLIENSSVAWLNLLQVFRNIFSEQKITKVILISALAAIRTGRNFGIDAIQKGAVHAMARTLALDLTKEGIYITEIMPGIVDTGFYDNKDNIEAVKLTGSELGYEYNEDNFPLFPAKRVGEAVNYVINTPAHIREISLIPYGQYPHLGA